MDTHETGDKLEAICAFLTEPQRKKDSSNGIARGLEAGSPWLNVVCVGTKS